MGFEESEVEGEEVEEGDVGIETAGKHHPADVAKVTYIRTG